MQKVDHSTAAEQLFRNFAARHSFTIEKADQDVVELQMIVAKQPGLSFELILGLQNGDELNIGFEEFWSFFFPFEKKIGLVNNALDGIATGNCRLAIHEQFGRVVKRVLEQRSNGRWEAIYVAYATFLCVPFLGTNTSYRYNDAVRSNGHEIR